MEASLRMWNADVRILRLIVPSVSVAIGNAVPRCQDIVAELGSMSPNHRMNLLNKPAVAFK